MAEAMKIVQVDPKTLVPAGYNPRRMRPRQRIALLASIEEFGLVQPIVVNRTTGHIVGGHQRVDAALNSKMAKVPVTYVELALEREKALNIALNKISGDWDTAMLVDVLAELEPTRDFDLTGFDVDEFQALEREPWHREAQGRSRGVDRLMPPGRSERRPAESHPDPQRRLASSPIEAVRGARPRPAHR